MEQKTEVPGFYKVDEGVVINKDNTALKAYKIQKAEKARLVQLEQDVSSMKSDLEEIKDLLRKVIK